MILSLWTLLTLTNWFLLNSHPRNVHSLKEVNVDIITVTGKILIVNNPLVKINDNSFHNSGLSLPVPSYLRHNTATTQHAIFGVTRFYCDSLTARPRGPSHTVWCKHAPILSPAQAAVHPLSKLYISLSPKICPKLMQSKNMQIAWGKYHRQQSKRLKSLIM